MAKGSLVATHKPDSQHLGTSRHRSHYCSSSRRNEESQSCRAKEDDRQLARLAELRRHTFYPISSGPSYGRHLQLTSRSILRTFTKHHERK
jgi:hypothetical protein